MKWLNIVLIVLVFAIIFAKISTDPYLDFKGIIQTYAISLTDVTLFVMLLFLDSYLLIVTTKQSSPTKKVLIFMFAVLISCLFISLISFKPDDEMVLSYLGYHAMLQGQNPYAVNFASQLPTILIQLGSLPTLLQNGSSVGYFSYPALYLLVQIPFYAAFNPSPVDLGHLVMPTEYIVYFTVFLYAYYLLIKERKSYKPIYSAIVLGSISFLVFSSTIIILGMAFMLMLFTTPGKKYRWLLLGLIASLQQELWIFVLLYLVYELRESGWGQFIKTSAMSCMVFLVINSYFILLSPSTYLSAYLWVAQLKPDTIAPVGGLLVALGVPGIVLTGMFICSIVGVVWWAFRYKPEVLWLPVLSAIPYIFISHALPVYFALPFTIFALLQDETDG